MYLLIPVYTYSGFRIVNLNSRGKQFSQLDYSGSVQFFCFYSFLFHSFPQLLGQHLSTPLALFFMTTDVIPIILNSSSQKANCLQQVHILWTLFWAAAAKHNLISSL